MNIKVGRVTWWANESLRDVGRMRYHGESLDEAEPTSSSYDVIRASFLIRRDPWLLVLASHSTPIDLTVWSKDLIYVQDQQSGEALVETEDLGFDLGLRALSTPSLIWDILDKRVEGNIDGSVIAGDPSFAPALVTLGADSYSFAYDPQSDMIVKWSATIDGQVAQETLVERFE